MTVISIIAINALFSIFAVGAVSIFWAWSKHFLSKTMTVWVAHLGHHVGEESQRSDHLVRWTTWTWSSWDLHTGSQPTCCVCDVGPCLPANQTRIHSGRIWSPMPAATVSGRRVSLLPHLHAACCEYFLLYTIITRDLESPREWKSATSRMKVPGTFSGTFTNSPYNWYNAYNSVIIEK